MMSKRQNCCEAINNSIGTFYEERSRITTLRSVEIEDRFRYVPTELATRSGIIFNFLRDLTQALLAKFATLSDPELCRSSCCASAAQAIQQIGSSYASDIYTAVGTAAFSIIALTTVIIPGLVTGYTDALNAIVVQSNCDDQPESGCGCKTKHRK